jgi:hypothetical protein
MTLTAIAGASVVKASLGSSQVSRKENREERVRLQGVINKPMAPVAKDAAADARERVKTARAAAKVDCASFHIRTCGMSRAASL